MAVGRQCLLRGVRESLRPSVRSHFVGRRDSVRGVIEPANERSSSHPPHRSAP
jgi:hypothetical protein